MRWQDRGAHFHRADFQVHTPRDGQWQGARPVSDEDREAFADSLIAACRAKALDAIAVTDHHDFAFFPFIKAAAAREETEQHVVVFPGLELTLGVPCQALLLLDPDTDLDRLPSVLEALAIEPTPRNEPSLGSVIRVDHIETLEDLHSALDTRTWLRDRYIVFPNVTDGGMGTLMRSGMQVKYKNMPCVGGYLDGTVAKKAKPGSGNRRKFDGLDLAWGNKRIALFQTSDSRNSTFVDLGKYSTWIKWSAPSAEALRQACLADKSRIAHEAPPLPSAYVSALHVSNSKFLGPFDLYFNPQYSAIIGGRGTGKSSILDYLRWCLADVPSWLDADEDGGGGARQRQLINSTLAPVDALVETEVMINGIAHVVRRAAASGELSLKVGDAEFARTTEAAIQTLLPIHAYSQKQLSSVAVKRDELLRFITAPIRQELDAKDGRIAALRDELRENYGSLQRARGLARTIARDEVRAQSLHDQAIHIRESLAGLSEEDQRFLTEWPTVDAARETKEKADRVLRMTADETSALVARVGELREILGPAPLGLPGSLQDLVGSAVEASDLELNSLGDKIQSALDEFHVARESDGGSAGVLAKVDGKLTELTERYADVKARSSAHQEQLESLSAVEGGQRDLADVIAAQAEEREGLGSPQERHDELRDALVRSYDERADLLDDQCRKVTDLSGAMLEVSVVRGKGFAQPEDRFRAMCSGSSIRAARYEALFAELAKETAPLETWELILSELEAIFLTEDGVELTSEMTPNLSRLGFPLADQERLRRTITVESWLELALAPVEEVPVFEYQTKEQEYIPFEHASAGQQATALLKVLLAQSGMPLIIDQPEEDLDSQVVQDVVRWLWDAKEHRQVLFASHNPNLVVNGDADLVVVCDYRRSGDESGGQLKLQGAIDVEDVRREITRVMEGGEAAFKLRKEKYGF